MSSKEVSEDLASLDYGMKPVKAGLPVKYKIINLWNYQIIFYVIVQPNYPSLIDTQLSEISARWKQF